MHTKNVFINRAKGMNMKTYLEKRIAEGLVRRIACQAWYGLPENDRRKNHDNHNKIIDKRQSVNLPSVHYPGPGFDR